MKKVGTFFIVFPDDVGGMVRGRIVVDDDLDREVGFLHQKTFQAISNVWLLVVGDRNDRDQGFFV